MKANDTWTLNTGILQSNIVRNTFVNLFVYILLHIEQKKDLCRCLLPKKSILKYKIKRIYMRKKAVGAKWLTIYALVEKWSISGYCKINIHSCLNPRIYKINLTRHRCGRDHCDWKWLREMNVSLGRRQIGAIRSRLWRMNLPNATVLATFVADFLSYLTRNWGTVVFPPATRSVVSGGYDCAVRELSCVWQCSRDLFFFPQRVLCNFRLHSLDTLRFSLLLSRGNREPCPRSRVSVRNVRKVVEGFRR